MMAIKVIACVVFGIGGGIALTVYASYVMTTWQNAMDRAEATLARIEADGMEIYE